MFWRISCNRQNLKFYALLVSTGSDSKFTVDANTGEIRTSPSALDREGKSVYQMTVVATDTGNRQVSIYLYIHNKKLLFLVFRHEL